MVLVFAVVRPYRLPEIVAAAPAAAVAVGVGLVSPERAWSEVSEMAPTVAFLVAILVLGHLADAMGVFTWLAEVLGRRSAGSPQRLLTWVFVVAAATTAVLSLDATIVLLTPAVIAAARSARTKVEPHSYAAAHLSNSASTLLPVSNLTNLIAFSATGLGFTRFAALMALPWIVTILVEYAAIRLFFHRALTARPAPTEPAAPIRAVQQKPAPTFALVVIAATLIGFGLSGVVGLSPFWPALVGALVLAIPALRDGRTALRRIFYAADLWFCGFVLLLGVVVAGVADGPVGSTIASLLPSDVSFSSLLAVGVVAALAANLINNLPATLLLLAALGPDAPPALVLALLIGVNLGPNLTYVGSLATMLWRRVTARAGAPADLRTYTLLGLTTTPLTLIAAITALWIVV